MSAQLAAELIRLGIHAKSLGARVDDMAPYLAREAGSTSRLVADEARDMRRLAAALTATADRLHPID